MSKSITPKLPQKLELRSKKDQRWDDRKRENIELEGIFKRAFDDPMNCKSIFQRFKNYPKRLCECALRLWFADRADLETGEEVLKLAKAEFCRIRHCPICQSRLSMRWIAKFHQIMPEIVEKYENTQFILLTLTVPNCEVTELKETIKEMNTAWNRMTNRAFFKKKILGFIRATEVTRNPINNTAHPHFHVLLHVRNSYFNGRNLVTRDQWRQYWRDAMRDQTITQVDVRKVRESESKTKEENLINGALEVVKYATKFDNITAHVGFFLEYAVQVDRMRFMATGGTLKELIADIDRDDLINIDEDESTKEENLSEDYGGRLCFKWDFKRNYRREPKDDFVDSEISEKRNSNSS